MRFLVDDICTHNKFECKVLSAKDEKIEIAYAVFLENGDKIFDLDDSKFVPTNRVKFVSRTGKENNVPMTPLRDHFDNDSLPSFSVRQTRWEKKQLEPIDLTADTESHIPIGKEKFAGTESNIPKSKKIKRNTKPKKILKVMSPSSSSGSPSSEFASSSDSSAGTDRDGRVGAKVVCEKPVRNPATNRVKSPRQKFEDITNPIVPDDWSDDFEESDASDESVQSDDSFSQEHTLMRKRAEELEKKADRGYKKLNDEVKFEWNSHKQRPGKFIEHDEEDEEVVVRSKQKSMEQILPMFAQTDLTCFDQLKDIAHYVDLISSIQFTDLTELINQGMRTREWPANISSELRLWLTNPATVFKTRNGWICAIQMSFYATWELKRNLFFEISKRIWDRIVSIKMQWAFLIASLSNMEWFPLAVPSTICVQLVGDHDKSNEEHKRIIEKFSNMLISSTLPIEYYQALVNPLGAMLRIFFPAFGTLYSLDEDRLVLSKRIIELVANFGSNSIKFGGFISSEGEERLNFGNHRGRSFKEIFSNEHKYCEWAITVPDPYSVEMIQLVDYICSKKYWCVPGARSVKGDVELIRLTTKRGPCDLSQWIERKVQGLKLCMHFYQVRPACMYSTYTACMYWIFQHLNGEVLDESFSVASFVRGEFVNEVIRPLMRLGEVAPEWKDRIFNAILISRAKVYDYSIEAARKDLESTHAIRLD